MGCRAREIPTGATFGKDIFMSSELSRIRSVRVGVNSSVMRSPMRSHSNDAIDRRNNVELCRSSLPLTYQIFDGMRFIETGIFLRTCSSFKFKSVTPIFKHPANIELYSVILISNGPPTTKYCSEKTRHRDNAGWPHVERLATVQC